MRRKFSSPANAKRFAKVTKMKVKKGPACKMADGKKGNWYTLTKSKTTKRRR